MRTENINAPVTITVGDGGYTVEKVVNYEPKMSLERATEDDADNIAALPLDEYVSLFKQREAQTAQSTLEMCRVVYEARLKLSEGQFREFCEQVGYASTSSTIRKFIAIGRVTPRLMQFAEQLPTTWTNIYLITQVPAAAFDEFIAHNGNLRDLKGKYLSQLVDATKPINSLTNHLYLSKKERNWKFATVSFTKKIDDIDLRAVEKAFAEVEARLPVKFTIDGELLRIANERKLKRYEAAKTKHANADFKPSHWDLGQEANSVAQAVTAAKRSEPAAANDDAQKAEPSVSAVADA